ncbi:LLM class flavin-dependent oxidoreductase [Bacillus pseudomycoides]|uniref:LLM class flavin-dependent oxidoreductase n=1 Tax=Bacillus pseudomycoides TaxID=64104 RepID=UPI000BEE5F14|nr:LLM class flavin-dependent oxidoreductase [Bacillus pseudomycoides]PEE36913.1 LLM class flavin-dependent oxidoreductase [Bacillus pseudomycoides]PGA83123.1 LLM class flavin-dependent oxidoreductase [Bacillus pseudomycoides]PHF26986.1 LLM class flavin-dependent oxidoreductase [Bacillus pseudomycoides]
MKFSRLTIFDHYPNQLSRTPRQFYNEVLEQTVRAEEMNFDGVWFTEHHFSDFGINSSPAVLLAAVSQRADKIRLGVGVSVLPLHNPLRIAEDYALVDLLSNGRLDLGLGSGYDQKEFDGYNISLEDKTQRFNESLEVLRKAWSGKPFSHQGKFFQYNDLKLSVEPIQAPFPPYWIVTSSEKGVSHVASMGSNFMGLGFSKSWDELAKLIDTYKNMYLKSGYGNPDQLEIPVAFHVHVGETYADAESNAKGPYQLFMNTPHGTNISYEVLKQKFDPVIGSPDEVIKQIQSYREIGVTNFMAVMNFGGLENHKVLSSLDLFGKYVIPACK